VRYLVATMVSLAVLATAFVGVRLHLEVAALRYAVYELDAERARAERELRLAQADYEATKSPRRLLERWTEAAALAAASVPAGAAPAATVPAETTPVEPAAPAASNPLDDAPALEADAPSPDEEGDR
jgi:hypothetical protein